jgi:hypothetical protein
MQILRRDVHVGMPRGVADLAIYAAGVDVRRLFHHSNAIGSRVSYTDFRTGSWNIARLRPMIAATIPSIRAVLWPFDGMRLSLS